MESVCAISLLCSTKNIPRNYSAQEGRRAVARISSETVVSTLSLRAGIDLLTGKVHASVENRHRSRECVGFLKMLDAAFPTETALKVILDNHSPRAPPWKLRRHLLPSQRATSRLYLLRNMVQRCTSSFTTSPSGPVKYVTTTGMARQASCLMV
jgi:hypothetical protein